MKKDIKIPEIDNFRDTVSQYSKKYKVTERIYLNAISDFKQRKLSELDESDTKSILDPFLLKWGQMGRVIGKEGCDKIRLKIVDLNEPLTKYRDYKLLNFDICDEKEEIKKVFTQLRNTKAINRLVGPTATSKILHIINPELFPMWDDKIRKKFGLYYGFASEYIEFMKEQKRWLSDENFYLTADKLSNKYSITILKVLDQYNWFIARRAQAREKRNKTTS